MISNSPSQLGAVLATLCVGCLAAQANADLVYTHSVELNQWIWPFRPTLWFHYYDHSVDPVRAATLTIEAGDVSVSEAQVWLRDSYGCWHFLGHLNPTAGQASSLTVFDLNSDWLDAMPVGTRIQWFSGLNNRRVWLGSSTLTVNGAVPAPAAAVLGLVGLGCLTLFSRRKRATQSR